MKKVTVLRILLVVIILASLMGGKLVHLDHYFSLQSLKSLQERFALLYAEHAVLVVGSYVVVYVLLTSLSIPGAVFMTIAGGALFGLWTGTVVVLIASTIGATMACAVSRFVLREWVRERFRGRVGKVNEGMAREGAFYLFTVRLIPIFPFWLVNLTMGLTGMPLRTFFWVSFVGMLPATVVYVNAGRELSRIDSVAGILTPRLLVSFALLGVFPLVAKKAIERWRSRRDGTPKPP